LLLTKGTQRDIARLLETVKEAHRQTCGGSAAPLVGLQLTHSGRYARPHEKGRAEPRILYHHPLLDARMGLPPDYPLLTDGDIREIIEAYHHAARLAWECGFDF